MPLIFWYFQNICVYVCVCRCVNVCVLACACEKWSHGCKFVCMSLNGYTCTRVYAESTVSLPWWSTNTQTSRYTLLSALAKCPPPCLCSRFFHQKRKWKTRSCLGEGGCTGGGSGRVWETERRREREGRCSHLELLYGTFTRGVSSAQSPLWIY